MERLTTAVREPERHGCVHAYRALTVPSFTIVPSITLSGETGWADFQAVPETTIQAPFAFTYFGKALLVAVARCVPGRRGGRRGRPRHIAALSLGPPYSGCRRGPSRFAHGHSRWLSGYARSSAELPPVGGREVGRL